jgi:SSS family solute:Na+ symporter
VYIILQVTDAAPALTNIHFLIQVPILFIIVASLNVVISNMSAPPPEDKVASLTWTRKIYQQETRDLQGLPWYQNYRILSLLLLILTAIIVIWFW